MRVCIFGAGSIGSCIGGLLAEDHEVTLVGRKANVEAIRSEGLNLHGAVERQVTLDAREYIADVPTPDLLIVTTKAYSTSAVIEACRDWVTDHTMTLTLQNGLGNLEQLRDWRGDMAIGGTTTMGASLVAPGKVQVAGLGRTILGSGENPKPAKALAAMFRVAGLPTGTKPDIQGEIWSKAIINASINPISAVLRVANGELIRSRVVSRLMSEICLECESVAAGYGITLPYKSMYARTRMVARQTASNRSSMLRDIELGRRTEIGNINGEICRIGTRMGVQTPLNTALVAMVESIEKHAAEKG